jgi:hypothetical protein
MSEWPDFSTNRILEAGSDCQSGFSVRIFVAVLFHSEYLPPDPILTLAYGSLELALNKDGSAASRSLASQICTDTVQLQGERSSRSTARASAACRIATDPSTDACTEPHEAHAHHQQQQPTQGVHWQHANSHPTYNARARTPGISSRAHHRRRRSVLRPRRCAPRRAPCPSHGHTGQGDRSGQRTALGRERTILLCCG